MALLLRRRGQAQAVVFYGLGSCVFPLVSEQVSENCSFKSMGFWLCLRLVVFVLYLARRTPAAYSEPAAWRFGWSVGFFGSLWSFGSVRSVRIAWLRSLVVGSFQAIKGVWWMPWGKVPTKDAISGETLGGAASERRSRDFRMGKPGRGNARSLPAEYIGRVEGTRGTETS